MTHHALSMAAELLELLSVPAAIYTHAGKILTANTTFKSHFDEPDRVLNDVAKRANLQKLLAAGGQPLRIAIRADAPRPSMLVQMRLLPSSIRQAWPEAYALFLGEPLTRALPPQQHLLLELFGLTPAEARIAYALASGTPTTAISSTLRVSHETVRSHVKSILRKLGVARQADLVALLSSASPLRCNYDTLPE